MTLAEKILETGASIMPEFITGSPKQLERVVKILDEAGYIRDNDDPILGGKGKMPRRIGLIMTSVGTGIGPIFGRGYLAFPRRGKKLTALIKQLRLIARQEA